MLFSKLVHCTKAIHHVVTELVMDSLHTFATKALASVPELHQVLVTCSACDEVNSVISYNIQRLELESVDPAPLAAVHVVAESQDDLYHSKIEEAL